MIPRFIRAYFLGLAFAPAWLLADPTLYRVTGASGSTYLLGGAQAPDESWLSAAVRDALGASATLWVEVPPPDPAAGIPTLREETVPGAGPELHSVVREEGYGNLAFGDYLDVAMGERSVVEAQRLDLDARNYRAMQPWLAWFTFAYAFWDRQQPAPVEPEAVLVREARARGMAVKSLFADRAEYYRFLGRMSDSAQTQYFQLLYNIMNAQRSGAYATRFGWVDGTPDAEWIAKMQQQTPSYYRFMYERRNPAIADQLAAVLADGGTHFVYVDVNRLVGPHNLLMALEAAGLQVEEL